MKVVRGLSVGWFPCMSCGHVVRLEMQGQYCQICHQKLFARDVNALKKSFIFFLMGLFFYMTSHFLPMMETNLFGDVYLNTIMGGVFVFIEHEDYFLALVIFFVSVLVPFFKFFVIFWVFFSIFFVIKGQEVLKIRLVHLVHLLGKWSMVDFFVVAVLSVLIQFGRLTSVYPSWGTLLFLLSVICTMFASKLIDLRLMYDRG